MGSPAVAGAAAPRALAAIDPAHILAALDQTGWRARGSTGAATLLGRKPITLESRTETGGLPRPS